MSIYASTVLNKAISYIGTKEVPAGSNTVIFNTEYYGKKVKVLQCVKNMDHHVMDHVQQGIQ